METSRIPSCRIPQRFRSVLARRRFTQVSPRSGIWQTLLAGWGSADTVFESPELAVKFSCDRIRAVHVAVESQLGMVRAGSNIGLCPGQADVGDMGEAEDG